MNDAAERHADELPEPDRRRWGDPASYKRAWDERARIAASLIETNASVLEIGVGLGVFRDLVKGRTAYVGADLQPLDAATLAIDLDRDPLPQQPFDCAVLLGVFGYLHQPEGAAKKICDAASRVIVSYCCRRAALPAHAVRENRRSHGWLNDFTEAEFVAMFARHGHELASSRLLKAVDEFEEFLMEFRRSPEPA